MISFNFISKPVYTVFNFNKPIFKNWIKQIILSENKKLGTIVFNFCTDDFLLEINKQYLNHNYYTDIISFDYSDGHILSGDIYISMDRIYDNSKHYQSDIFEELLRVLSHGILHFSGYKDKTETEILVMRAKEIEKIQLFKNCFT
ncbi:MAG: rRNA maturation RNase YbeY [Flavobacterium sp.]